MAAALHPVLEVSDRRVAVTTREYQGVRRMTLIYAEVHRARDLLWIVTGQEKVGKGVAGV